MARVPGLSGTGLVWTPAGRRGAGGQPIAPRADRVRYEEAAYLKQHYEATSGRDISECSYRVAHLTAFFAGRRIGSISRPCV